MEDKMDLIRSAKIQLDTDKAMVADRLLKNGWTSTLDIAIEVNKQNFYNERDYGTGIAYYLKYLLVGEEGTRLFNNRKASKLIYYMNKTWLFVQSSLNNNSINTKVSNQFIKTVKIQFKDEDSFKESDLKDDTIMVYYKKTKQESPRKKNTSPDDINTDEDLNKKKLINECDEKLLQYNLSPATMLLINFMKELLEANIQKTLKHLNKDEKKREEEEALRIMKKYKITKEDWAKVISIKSTNHFNIYIYSNPNCSFLEDWTRYQTIKEAGQIYDKSAPRKRKISDRHNQINMAPPSGALHRTIQFESYKDLLLQQANANIGEVRKNIKNLEVDKPNGWIESVSELYENEVLIDVSFVKQYGEVNEKEIDEIVDKYGKHILNHIKMDYFSLIIRPEDYTHKIIITKSDVSNLYFQRLKDFTSLINTDYISVDNLNNLWSCCNDLMKQYFLLDKKQQQRLGGFQRYVLDLQESISYIVPMCKIEVLMKIYVYNLVPVISKIIYPINQLIIRYGTIKNFDMGKNFKCDEARLELIDACKDFIVKLQRKSQEDDLMICIIGMLLADLEDNYPDPLYYYNNSHNSNPYNIDQIHNTIFNSESVFNHYLNIYGKEVWSEIVRLFEKYRWEQERLALLKNLWDDNFTPEDVVFRRNCISSQLIYLLETLRFYMGNDWAIKIQCESKLSFDLDYYIDKYKIIHSDNIDSNIAKILLIASYTHRYLQTSSSDGIHSCKKRIEQVLDEVKSIDFNDAEMDLIYFLASFKLIDSIYVGVNEKKVKREEITEVKDWLKSNLTDKIQVHDFTQVLIEKLKTELDYLLSIIED